MKPHPRIRKFIKWGGLVLSLLLAGVWIGSGWYHLEYSWKGGTLGASCGVFVFNTDDPTLNFGYPLGWSCGRIHGDPFLWRSLDQVRPEFHNRYYPLWPAVGVVAIFTVPVWIWDWVLRRRARVGFCPKCHYDRTGLAVGAKCPECGTAGAPA